MAENPEDTTTTTTSEAPGGREPVYCRHCGAEWAQAYDSVHLPLGDGPPTQLEASGGDWLCPSCDRYQDATTCPTCGGNARISLLPENLRPEAHKPARRSRGRE